MESNGTSQTLVDSIQSEITTLPEFSPSRCIYRVPRLLRQVNEQAYTPVMVSIGPFHHKDPNFLPMEVHKLKYLDSFLCASKMGGDLQSYVQLVKDNETKIRQSYSNPTTQLSSTKFIRMILIDSTFIIELFRRIFNPSLRENDHIFGPPVYLPQVDRDIRLAENQLPFFILKDLYWTAFKPDGKDVPFFTDIACVFLQVDKSRVHIDANTQEATCCHLLDLLHANFILPFEVEWKHKVKIDDMDKSNEMSSMVPLTTMHKSNEMCSMIPPATSLHEAGIKFQANHGSYWLLDIHFNKEKGILTMPSLRLTDGVEEQFRNLIAYEQCHYFRNATYIRRYLIFLDQLINTSQDVELLVKAGVLVNCLGSEKYVFNVLNTLCKNVAVSFGSSHYAGIINQLQSYCDKPWNCYRATLKRMYFGHPWAVISMTCAVFLFIFTLVQVLTGIISLSHDKCS